MRAETAPEDVAYLRSQLASAQAELARVNQALGEIRLALTDTLTAAPLDLDALVPEIIEAIDEYATLEAKIEELRENTTNEHDLGVLLVAWLAGDDEGAACDAACAHDRLRSYVDACADAPGEDNEGARARFERLRLALDPSTPDELAELRARVEDLERDADVELRRLVERYRDTLQTVVEIARDRPALPPRATQTALQQERVVLEYLGRKANEALVPEPAVVKDLRCREALVRALLERVRELAEAADYDGDDDEEEALAVSANHVLGALFGDDPDSLLDELLGGRRNAPSPFREAREPGVIDAGPGELERALRVIAGASAAELREALDKLPADARALHAAAAQPNRAAHPEPYTVVETVEHGGREVDVLKVWRRGFVFRVRGVTADSGGAPVQLYQEPEPVARLDDALRLGRAWVDADNATRGVVDAGEAERAEADRRFGQPYYGHGRNKLAGHLEDCTLHAGDGEEVWHCAPGCTETRTGVDVAAGEARLDQAIDVLAEASGKPREEIAAAVAEAAKGPFERVEDVVPVVRVVEGPKPRRRGRRKTPPRIPPADEAGDLPPVGEDDEVPL